MRDMRVLAGDVGGTKTALACFELRGKALSLRVQKSYPSRAFVDLDAVLAAFQREHPTSYDCASLAVAGPVSDRRAQVTNLPWTIDARALETEFALPRVHLINDVQALALAVSGLGPEELRTVVPGTAVPTGTIAVAAPGTGLGEAFLVWDGTRYEAYPSEGGHSGFAPATHRQTELLTFLLQERDHVSVEHVCSGRGIPDLFRFLRDRLGMREEGWLREQLAEEEDLTPTIIEAAMSEQSPLCGETMRLFAELLGAELGNLALRFLATGGIYVGGGIPPRILPFLEDGNLWKAFVHKGRLEALLATIPIHVILEPGAALRGAARHAVESCSG